MRRFATACLAALGLAAAVPCQTVLYELTGTAADQLFGSAVAPAGDVDGDGRPDLLVGASGDDTTATDAGAAFVFSGVDGTCIRSWFGEAAGDGFGVAVDGVGDVDDDGFDDVVVGAYRHDAAGEDAGRVVVFSGADGRAIHVLDGLATEDEFGIAVSAAGDLDGDGRPDFLVGAHHGDDAGINSGRVQVFSGADAAVLLTVTGVEALDDLGHAADGGGDIDGDGVPDVAAGAHDSPDAGSAYVFSGADATVLGESVGASSGDFYGRAIAFVGDVDGDGLDEVLIGAERDGTNGMDAGRAELRAGADFTVLYEYTGAEPLDFTGSAVAAAGDFDGDGCPDFAIGSHGDDDGAPNAGTAALYSGATGALIIEVDGVTSGLRSDVSVAGLGDLDGDGTPEVAVGFSWDTTAAPSAGRVVVISGAAPRWTALGPGLAGALGLPVLEGKGALLPGSPIRLILRDALPSSTTTLVVGLGVLGAPFAGGTLWPTADVLLTGLTVGPDGGLELTSAWPAGVPGGTTLAFQYWIADARAPAGLAASNGILATAP